MCPMVWTSKLMLSWWMFIFSFWLTKMSISQINAKAFAFSVKGRNSIMGAIPIRGWELVLSSLSVSRGDDDGNMGNPNSVDKNSMQRAEIPTPKHGNESVVSRLKQAAIRASAAAAMAQQQENVKMKNTFFSSHSPLTSKIEKMKNTKAAVTLRQLTSAIDSQLHRNRDVPWEQYQTHMIYQNQQQRFHNNRHQVSALPRDAMVAIVTHNCRNQVSGIESIFRTPTITHQPNVNMTTTTAQRITAEMSIATIRHVAILFMKKSMVVNGRRTLTIESAGRIQRLVDAMYHEGYKPNLIIFVGEVHATSTIDMTSMPSGTCNVQLSDADLGYSHFINSVKHADGSSIKIDLKNVSFHIEQSATSMSALSNIATFIQKEHVIQWLEAAAIEAGDALVKTAIANQKSMSPVQPQPRRWKLHIQFALISSDYHLCILNDIHDRSPGQSSLRELDRWSLSSILKNVTMFENNKENYRPNNFFSGIQLETSWVYMYSTTANLHRRAVHTFSQRGSDNEEIDDIDSNFAIASFSSACYQRAQDLIPVLHNLRGVVANEEFFQRENYRVLVQARRQLVSGMEQLYRQQPSLAAIHKIITPLESSHNVPTLTHSTDVKSESAAHQRSGKPLDVVLEGALLSLGRCLDLVRPAGLLTGSVPAHDFKLAAMVLNQALTQISIACDPDRPIVVEFTSPQIPSPSNSTEKP